MTHERFAETLDISVDFLTLIEKVSRRLKIFVAGLFTFRDK